MEKINSELKTILDAYTSGLIGLAYLKEWLAERIWELVDSPLSLDRMVVGKLLIAVSELDRGDRDEGHVSEVSKELLIGL